MNLTSAIPTGSANETQPSRSDDSRNQYADLSDLEWLRNRVEYLNRKPGTKPSWSSYDCPICKNRGYLSIINEELMTIESKDCECQIVRKAYRFAAQNGMADKLSIRLEDWKVTKPWQETVRQLATNYIERDLDNWFVMLGQPGAGKTMMCSIIAAAQLKRGRQVRYITWPDLIATLMRNMKSDKPDFTLRDLCEVEVLFLDDLFKNDPGNWARDKAFELINYRYNTKKRTIISSEKTIVKLNQIDVAISSRIQHMAGNYLTEISNDPKNNWRTK